MTTVLVLAVPNFEKVFTMESDASRKGISAILSKKGIP